MTTEKADLKQEPKFFKTLRDDLRTGDITNSIRREFRDTREFMLDDRRKKELAGMSRLKRWIYTGWWMLKSMFFKLTPARRILFVGGLVFVLLAKTEIRTDDNIQIGLNTNLLGIVCIVLVLMLELKDKLEAKEELEAGRIVQDALQPDRSPQFAGWSLWLFTRSANEVGGDLVDFIRISDSRAGVVLADVAGKGLRAALLMAKLQSTVRALADDFASLSELASRINRIFCRDGLKNIFASMVYIELTVEPGSVRLVNAGHFPPLVARADGVVTLAKGGAALGLTPSAVYAEERTILGSGDLLCAYSDGVTEAQNEAGEFFGEQRIREILHRNLGKPTGLAGTELVGAVDRFVGEAKQRDDLTLVIIGRDA